MMMRMLLSSNTTRALRRMSSGRIVVNPPPLTKTLEPRQKRVAQQLIKTNLAQHFEQLKSMRLDPENPPSSYNESGIVSRDLTEEMIDLKEMYDPRLHLPNAPRGWKGYEESTPLSQEIVAYTAVRGQPLTVADYMRQALTHEYHGYYTNPTKPSHDDWDDDDLEEEDTTSTTPDSFIIGRQGDFVTAPEVSQVFGECLAVWFVTQYQTQANVQLVEVGPGKGTLMQDVLRSLCTSFHEKMGNCVRQVHLVEASPAMRQEQKRKLQDLNQQLPNVNIVFYDDEEVKDDDKDDAKDDAKDDKVKTELPPSEKQVISVHWHATFSDFVETSSPDLPTFVMCQEFIDALPVHVFEKTQGGWRERMVDVAIQEDDDEEEVVKKEVDDSQEEAKKEDDDDKSSGDKKKEEKKTRLRVVLSPDVSPACKTLLNIDEETGQKEDDTSPVGQVAEVCPEGILLVQDISQLLKRNGGAALIVDYGQEGSTDSLRGFSRHEQVSFLSRPGQVDVTADVDFEALRHAVNHANSDATCDKSAFAFGPATQGTFLASMGIVERVVSLIEDDKTTDEEAEDLYNALERLVLPEQMGERYKVLAIARKKEAIFAPPGF